MSEHIGGKGSGASSSSEFLRAYRIGVLAGANASYTNIPKKTALSYATSDDLLEARNKRGVLADLSGIIVTDCKCPVVNPGPTQLEYVSTNIFAQFLSNPICWAYINTGDMYFASSVGGSTGIWALNPLGQVRFISETNFVPGVMIQSLIDGKIYTVSSTGDFYSYTIGGFGFTFLTGSGIIPPRAITQDNLGNFYIISTFLNSIYKVTPSFSVSVLSSVSQPTGITYASDGNLYVTTNFGQIYRFTTSGNGILFFEGSNSGYPTGGIIQANDGNLYVSCFVLSASFNGMVVFRITLTGILTYFGPITSDGAQGDFPTILQAIDENFYLPGVGNAGGAGNIYQIVVR
jgi:hypothetical protein